MSDKIFLDSNVLIYCYSTSDLEKQTIARGLSAQDNSYISTQVINETVNVLSKKYQLSWGNLSDLISDLENNFFVHLLSTEEIKNACAIAERYRFSFFDSLILASAMKCQCSILYSEDMQHNQLVDNKIRIINPFV